MNNFEIIFNQYIEGEENIEKPTRTFLEGLYHRFNHKLLFYLLYFKIYPKHLKKQHHIYNEEASEVLIQIIQDSNVSIYHIAILLLYYDANPNYFLNINHKTIIHYLSSNKLLDCFELLLYYYDTQLDYTMIDIDQKQTILIHICNMNYTKQQEKCIKSILESFLYDPKIHNFIDYKDIHEKTALDYTIEHCNYYIIQQLLISFATVQYNDSFHNLKKQSKYKKLTIEDSIDYHCSRIKLYYYRLRYSSIDICYRMLLYRYHQEIKYNKKYIPSNILTKKIVINENNNIKQDDVVSSEENRTIHIINNNNNNNTNNNDNNNDNNDTINHNINTKSMSYPQNTTNITTTTTIGTFDIPDYRIEMRTQSKERKHIHRKKIESNNYEDQIEYKRIEYMKKMDKEYHVSYHGLFA